MKKQFILAIVFVSLTVAGFTCIDHAFAQKQKVQTSNGELLPAAGGPAVLVDDFTASAGTPLTATGWNAHSAAGTNPISTIAGSLSYTGYPSSGVGNSVSMTTSGEDDDKTFPIQNTGSVYAAAMVNVSAAQATGDYFMHLD